MYHIYLTIFLPNKEFSLFQFWEKHSNADVTPVFKIDQGVKEDDFKPASIRPTVSKNFKKVSVNNFLPISKKGSRKKSPWKKFSLKKFP